MRYLMLCSLSLLLLAVTVPLWAAPWSSVPLAQWSEARTVDSCTEAMPPDGPPPIPENHRAAVPVPQPPFGRWQEAGGAAFATGRANCWSTLLQPGAPGPDTRITVRFTVEKSSGVARQLPGGCVRWGFHWGENLPGWDAGVVLGYQDPLNFYRVQLSAARGELALWDATGGFLQLIPCPMEVGKPHELTVTQHGAHLLASVDGKPVMDYWDRTLPYTQGRAGLAVWKSRTRFERFSVERLAADPTPLPPHRPAFSFEPAQNLLTGHPGFHMDPHPGVILFDGREPISFYYKVPGLFQEGVKLKPGWRSEYYSEVGPSFTSEFLPLAGDLPDAFKVTASGETLTFTFALEQADLARCDYTCTVRFDPARQVYRYEYAAKIKMLGPKLINEYQIMDPLTYNNRAPGPEVEHTWNPAGHRWWVYQAPAGGWERVPIVDYLTDYNNQPTPWGKLKDFLYPDPAVCPAWEEQIDWPQPEGRLWHLGQCTWGYDYHHREVGRNFTMPAGDVRTFSYALTGLPPDEAKSLFDQSKLPARVAADTTKLIPFDPSGTNFRTTTNWQDPSSTMLWDGALDTTVGHGDRASLRIDGPGKAGVQIYQHMIEQYADAWWVRGWFRTRGVKGTGLKLAVSYSYGKDAEDTFYLGGLGDRDWTYFSFLTTAPRLRDCSSLLFSLDGAGQAWLDDVAISAVPGAKPPPKVTAFIMPDSIKPRTDLVIDLTMADQPERGVYDESHNGNSLSLKGATWVQEAGRSFLRLDGVAASGSLPFSPVLDARPGPPGDEAYRPLFALDRFTYEFWVRPRPPATAAIAKMLVCHSRFNPQVYFDQLTAKPGECRFVYQNNVYKGPQVVLSSSVPYDQWLHVVATHGDGKVVLYLNGVAAGQVDYDPKALGFDSSVADGVLWVGAWRYGGSNLTGDLGPFRLYTKALTPAEAKQRYEQGWPAR